jgi:hypothetical protein
LNLKSTSFSAVLHGAPVFTTDRGYLGVDNSSTVYIDTQVSGTMSPGLNYTAFESHISAWSNTNFQTVSSGGVVMGVHCSTCDFTLLAPWQNSDALFANVGTISTSAVSDSLGFYVANRCCVGNVGGTFTAYKNTTQVINVSNTVGTLYSGPIVILAYNDANLTGGPGPISGGAYQISAATIGGSLDVTQEGNLHARLRTYLTAVGVP